MDTSKIRAYCAAFPICVLAVVWFIFQPAGSYGGIFFMMALIASAGMIALFYGGPVGKMWGGAIGMLFLLGSIGVAARGSFDTEAFDRLAKKVKPYKSNVEYVEELSRGPGLRPGQTIWRLKTSDSAAKVKNFYLDESNHSMWELTSDKEPLVFESEDEFLVVKIEASSGMTHIQFDLKPLN